MHLILDKRANLVFEPTDDPSEPLHIEFKQTYPYQRRQQHQQVLRSKSYVDEECRYQNRKNASIPTSPLLVTGPVDVNLNATFGACDAVLRYCRQLQPLPFEQVYGVNELRSCRKIGEGVYSEVFMSKNEQTGKPIVLKIIPIEGRQFVNGERQKKFDEVLSEIVISSSLAELRFATEQRQHMTSNFAELQKVQCVRGKYPAQLVDLWELYRDNFNTLNDNPEIFNDDQLYIVLELSNGGQDLEEFTFVNAQQSLSAFIQIALSFAIAEKAFEFEHRDLHWGNVLLLATDEPTLTYRFNGATITVPTHGVRATIIDFTFSRARINSHTYFNDLAHEDDLFAASGDYQYDIYRCMRDRLKNTWCQHDAYTNALWLHYVIDKMIHGAHYKSSKTKKHRAAIDRLMQFRDDILDYASVADFVESFVETRDILEA